jgi:ribosomal protein S18 acetylase RimI-like enzyme
MPRFVPERIVSPRDLNAMGRFFALYATGERELHAGTELFIAVDRDQPAGLLAIRSDQDYFTGHPRAYIELLAVAETAEGRGVGRALMEQAEAWAREHGCIEVVLDVFASNAGAIAFYRRLGFEVDHMRMAKPISASAEESPAAES